MPISAPSPSPVAKSVPVPKTDRNLVLGGLSTLLGIAVTLAANAELGSWLVLAGLIVVVVQLHRLGRSGPKLEWIRSHSATPQ